MTANVQCARIADGIFHGRSPTDRWSAHPLKPPVVPDSWRAGENAGLQGYHHVTLPEDAFPRMRDATTAHSPGGSYPFFSSSIPSNL